MSNKNLKTIAEFAGHMVTGVAVFAVVGAGCLALHYLVEVLTRWGVDGFSLFVLKAVDTFFTATDFISLIAWAYVSTARALRELFVDNPEDDDDEEVEK